MRNSLQGEISFGYRVVVEVAIISHLGESFIFWGIMLHERSIINVLNEVANAIDL
jgi:hypothetical protein